MAFNALGNIHVHPARNYSLDLLLSDVALGWKQIDEVNL
jgi:hypothetical protein